MNLQSLNTIFLPSPYGLYNTGSICYLNSLLQILAGCTSLYNINIPNNNELCNTFQKYIDMIKSNNIHPQISNDVLTSLKSGVKYFGYGQESASEAFILIINYIDYGQLTKLFTHRYKCTIICEKCKNKSITTDTSLILNLFHVTDVTEKDILNQFSKLEDYKCEKCNSKTGMRIYSLTMLPEILLCSFNIYHKKEIHKFPEQLIFPGKFEKEMKYKLIGQVEHSGSLHGGHYWSRALRKNNEVYICNDYQYSTSKFEPTANTYMIIYHKI